MTSKVRKPPQVLLADFKPRPTRTVQLSDVIKQGGQGDPNSTYVETVAKQFDRCGFRFVPLVCNRLDLVCGLDILFLRRENPGDLLSPGGDIDNRIKTLLDALRVPRDGSEISGTPEAGENPFFCLLEDDCLVTDLNVTTDRLLRPLGTGSHKNDVLLIMQVRIKAVQISVENLSLLS